MTVAKNPTTGSVVDLFGPTIEFLVPPTEAGNTVCALRGMMPAGSVIPLHSHEDTEDFVVISGEIQALQQGPDSYVWRTAQPGDHLHVPSGVPHAWRNVSQAPVVILVFTTPKLSRFFQEVGRAVTPTPTPPTPEDLARFLALSDQYGYWNASPEENAAVGIHLGPA
jgi:quercetin dioxygenase-like cupin family protein